MRVGIFTEVYKPYVSGVVTSILMLKKSLEDLGHEVYVVTINMDKVKYEYDEKERVLRVPGINSGIYDNFKVSSIYPIKSTNRIKKWNLDIIHTHTEGSMGTYGRLLGKQFNIPIIVLSQMSMIKYEDIDFTSIDIEEVKKISPALTPIIDVADRFIVFYIKSKENKEYMLKELKNTFGETREFDIREILN